MSQVARNIVVNLNIWLVKIAQSYNQFGGLAMVKTRQDEEYQPKVIWKMNTETGM